MTGYVLKKTASEPVQATFSAAEKETKGGLLYLFPTADIAPCKSSAVASIPVFTPNDVI